MDSSGLSIICATYDDIEIFEAMSYDSTDPNRSFVRMDNEQVRKVTCLKKP